MLDAKKNCFPSVVLTAHSFKNSHVFHLFRALYISNVMLVKKEDDPFLQEYIISPRGGSSILKECIIRKVKFFDLQIWANLQILEVKTIIRGLFPGNIVLLRCVLTINELGLLCSF